MGLSKGETKIDLGMVKENALPGFSTKVSGPATLPASFKAVVRTERLETDAKSIFETAKEEFKESSPEASVAIKSNQISSVRLRLEGA